VQVNKQILALATPGVVTNNLGDSQDAEDEYGAEMVHVPYTFNFISGMRRTESAVHGVAAVTVKSQPFSCLLAWQLPELNFSSVHTERSQADFFCGRDMWLTVRHLYCPIVFTPSGAKRTLRSVSRPVGFFIPQEGGLVDPKLQQGIADMLPATVNYMGQDFAKYAQPGIGWDDAIQVISKQEKAMYKLEMHCSGFGG
jgi:hypothetical protein